MPHCLRFDRHQTDRACAFARASAGNKSPARTAMIAITTSNSIKVKAAGRRLLPPANLRWMSAALLKRASLNDRSAFPFSARPKDAEATMGRQVWRQFFPAGSNDGH
jgi:hypothetical protein